MFYHSFDPVIVQLGPVAIKWYGISYLVGFFLAWRIGVKRIQFMPNWNKDQVTELIFYSAWGTIIGGRLGYWLFYGLDYIVQDPLEIFKIWNGGMSFHGGLIGVVCSLWFFCRKYSKSFHEVIDYIAVMAPVALFCGRIGNFINADLYGRVTDVPWAVIFPYGDGLPRHPSQLYEAFLEGILLAIFLWYFAKKPRSPWSISAVFLLGYGTARFIVEFFRQPDGYVDIGLFDWLTKGQFLSLPMIIIGIAVLWYNSKLRNRYNEEAEV